jgi:hypothetical protein
MLKVMLKTSETTTNNPSSLIFNSSKSPLELVPIFREDLGVFEFSE